MSIHYIDCWPDHFDAVKQGRKAFEIRSDDRGYKVGDCLVLTRLAHMQRGASRMEGYQIVAFVTYKIAGGQFGIQQGYCALSLDVPHIKKGRLILDYHYGNRSVDSILLSPKYTLLKPYSFEFQDQQVTVPKGFVTDFCAVSGRLKKVFGENRAGSEAFLRHDALYQEGRRNRHDIDLLLRSDLKAEGMGFLKRSAIYIGLRLFGRKYFGKGGLEL